MEEKKTYLTKMEEATAAQGNWGSEDRGCMMFARVQGLTIAAKNCYGVLEKSVSDQEFDELLGFLGVSDAEDLKKMYSDDQIFKYRTVNKFPLKGLVISGKDRVPVDFHNLPEDHMIPEVIELQRNYVVYWMVAMCRKKMFMVTNRKMTRADVEKMDSDMFARLVRLVDVLADSMTDEERKESEWNTLKMRIDAEVARRVINAV